MLSKVVWFTVTPLIGLWGSIIEVHGTAEWETDRNSGKWTPDDELAAGLTGP